MADVSVNSGITGGARWGVPAWLRRVFTAAAAERGTWTPRPEDDDRRDFFLEMLDGNGFQSEADFQEAMTVYPGRF